MKKLILLIMSLFMTITTLQFQSCTENVHEEINGSINTHVKEQVKKNLIDLVSAKEIANSIVCPGGTRSDSKVIESIEYVCRQGSTRSGSASSDTIAYIINYSDEGGFAIVSADDRVFPILGYSHEGNFSLSNEIAFENFISNIGSYIDAYSGGVSTRPNLEEYQEICEVPPIVDIVLGQRGPWDKYVIEEHPSCPTGCVAVASALVMSYSRRSMTYHDEHFNFRAMTKAIHKKQTNDDSVDLEIDENGVIQPIYSYETAVDKMAKLLYWIGKDVNMSYSPSRSGALSIDAFNLCSQLKFTVPSGFADFNIIDITNYLQNGCIIYMRGSGHAWVCDGFVAVVDKKCHTNIYQTYVHCDWGWYGSGNGYFTGDVFSVSSSNYRPSNYFAVSM